VKGLRRERWTHPGLAEAVGMSESQAPEILRAAEIKPHLLEQWVMSDLGPDFDAQAAEVGGLYVDPPEGTLVVSIDEKTGIQAKAPMRADMRARPGKPGRREHEYRRNGTQKLLAALRVHTGEVSAMPSKTRNRFDLLLLPRPTRDGDPSLHGGDRDQRQPLDPDNPGSKRLTRRPSALAVPLHAKPRELAQPGRGLLLDPRPPPPQTRQLHQRAGSRPADARIRRDLQPNRPPLQMDIDRGKVLAT
jgi:hypothetical protein